MYRATPQSRSWPLAELGSRALLHWLSAPLRRVLAWTQHSIVPPTPELVLDPVGFRVREGSETLASLCWSEVRAIVAHRLGPQASDAVWLSFRVSDEGDWILVPSDWQGFTALAETVQAVFPDVPEDWLVQMSLPHDAPHARILFDRTEAEGLAQR